MVPPSPPLPQSMDATLVLRDAWSHSSDGGLCVSGENRQESQKSGSTLLPASPRSLFCAVGPKL